MRLASVTSGRERGISECNGRQQVWRHVVNGSFNVAANAIAKKVNRDSCCTTRVCVPAFPGAPTSRRREHAAEVSAKKRTLKVLGSRRA